MSQPGGGTFAVDMAQAPKAIRELEQARDELESIKDDALVLGDVRPPTNDAVSRDAAQMLAQTAVGGPASLMLALDAGIKEITNLINAMRAGFAHYEKGDDQARSDFLP